jgi:hypothetical protein
VEYAIWGLLLIDAALLAVAAILGGAARQLLRELWKRKAGDE